MKKIKLTQNKITAIDLADANTASKYKWYYMSCGYAATRPWDKETKTYKTIYLHRYIMNAKKGDLVDHINGDTLDNRRSNLRICSHKQNIRNAKAIRSNNTSGHRGVAMIKKSGRWLARICVDYKNIHIGCFSKKEEAIAAYKESAKKHFGEFSR